jgi:ubiquinol-cytochrome c reductase iron-sulfur subunit
MADSDRKPGPDLARRRMLTAATATVGGLAVAGAAVPFIESLEPSARAVASGAPVKFDLGGLKPAELATVQWRSRPVWVLHRTPAQLATLAKVAGQLSDPRSTTAQQPPDMKLDLAQGVRALRPQTLVLVGICTHLGCIPSYHPEPGSLGPGWPGGFYCPCHGSKYDLSGRVFSGSPAPLNLPVPPYAFTSGGGIVVGEVQGGGDQNWQPQIW